MKDNEAIEIMTAQNGYIVRGAYKHGECVANENMLVCQTFKELTIFLSEHFAYRCKVVETDK